MEGAKHQYAVTALGPGQYLRQRLFDRSGQLRAASSGLGQARLQLGGTLAARAVQAGEAAELWNAERRPVLALFDGEPVTLAPGARLRATQSRTQLLATRAEAA